MKSIIALETVLLRKSETPSTDISGEIGLMNIDTGKYFALNTIGSEIWKKLENPTSLQDLINSLIAEYDIDFNSCLSEVKPFMEQLIQEGIVTVQ